MERHTYESFSKSWFSAETLILPSLPLQVSLSTDRQPSSWDVEVFTSSYKKLSVKLFFHGEDDATLTKLQVMATTIERLIHLHEENQPSLIRDINGYPVRTTAIEMG